MPDQLMIRVKQAIAERRTTFRALVVDALEQVLAEKPGKFRLRDASVGSADIATDRVSKETINTAIETQRESHFIT